MDNECYTKQFDTSVEEAIKLEHGSGYQRKNDEYLPVCANKKLRFRIRRTMVIHLVCINL